MFLLVYTKLFPGLSMCSYSKVLESVSRILSKIADTLEVIKQSHTLFACDFHN